MGTRGYPKGAYSRGLRKDGQPWGKRGPKPALAPEADWVEMCHKYTQILAAQGLTWFAECRTVESKTGMIA
mgnify:CR=1